MSGAHRRYGGRDDADDGDDPALTEVRLAHRVEDRLTKDEILARYLDLVYFGRGAYGVEAAARTWFGTSAAALTAPQAALLAGMMRARDLRPPPEGCTGARPGTGFLCREVVDRLAAVVAPGRDRRPVLALAAKRTYRNDAAAGETALPLGGSVPAATWFDLMTPLHATAGTDPRDNRSVRRPRRRRGRDLGELGDRGLTEGRVDLLLVVQSGTVGGFAVG